MSDWWKDAPIAKPPAGGEWWKAAPEATQGGVQDYEPDRSAMPEPTLMDRVNRGVNWLGTRATKAATGLLGTPRGVADLTRMAPEVVGGPTAKSALNTNSFLALAPFMPSAQGLNDIVFNHLAVPEVSSKTRVGKVADAATEAALSSIALPGNVLRMIIPAAAGGASQEIAGQATEGTAWEPAARILAGVAGGAGVAAGQNLLGNLAQGVRNLAPNVDRTAAKIIGRGMTRDRVTGDGLAQAQAGAPGSMLIEAGGPNVRGVMRGSIAAPGAARTTAQDAFDARIEGSNARTTQALDKSVSPVNSLATSVDDISTLRAQQSAPAYQAAGIPDRIQMTETTVPGEPVKKIVPVMPGFKKGAMAEKEVIEPGAPVTQRSFNTPNISSPTLDKLLKESADMQAAIAAARRLPEYKYLPDNSMAMLDKAYKHLNGMEQEARRAGNGTRVHDLSHLRTDLKNALVEANPKYGEALAAYEGPSKLIDAAERAKEWFTKNVDPAVVTREFETMKAAGLDDAARIGVRDWARATIGRSDRGVAAERVWNGGDNRARLEAILSPQDFKDFTSVMGQERNLIKTARDTNVGSRTTPMALEAADNAIQVGDVSNLLHGRFANILTNALGRSVERVTQGRTESVNARIAEMLTSTDPAKVGLVKALLEQARLQELARSRGRINALTYGGAVAPSVNALSSGGAGR